MIDLLIPVLGRPESAKPLVDSISAATTVPHRVLFLCSPGDKAQIASCLETGAEVIIVDFPVGRGDYPRKINVGYEETDSEWLFTGADDLFFHPGWAEAALRAEKRVVGTSDLGNPEARRSQRFSTHCLIARSYVDELGTIDGPGKVFSEAYDHNWCDREMADTARSRGEWAYAQDSVVEHLHFHWGKGQEDETYRKGLKNFTQDRRIYQQRMKAARIRFR